ncbi:MAG: bifunctional methylenetetrahydrofolate dehydrogenase/methenyltetrahydrofolate cyclohydrolase FolD [Synechococcus sp. SB0666_bin_14]|nr:bifunctional methylenetetrahydrofolate dehydrogenase/methenyltetrahydrofolate cyclohydrolase FolD [Synechococcus sp. SB0666_bin_14]MYA91587.1 bifunctional methylenetetrahydrofolate dehydrogenase/methenyltetrahydrofolate cyclohydrolase FolD [Synechococcus sp. SB0663_bin_10]MYG46670.1 bifunctional methylenetetrahydrofolate dehydrogenase/methenyltetrahydrofolate cyclohydrolase FolD [Synechococcus sp. SB0675_bin_6]MYJ60004.1 bifunctional methylenetetrahydrofolate dehydrogenase/methenyltetrahydrof
MAKRLDGRLLAARHEASLRSTIAQHLATAGCTSCPPGLVVVRVGDDPASGVYVRKKAQACGRVGIESRIIHHPATASQQEVLESIHQLNGDSSCHGILVQLPIPPTLNACQLLLAVDPSKDVDGLHPLNLGRLMRGEPGLRSCTPAGVMALLDHGGIALDGTRALVIGRSILVGQPLGIMLQQANATVTVAHSHTRNLADHCRQAELLVVAAGKPGLVGADWVRPGVVVVDVGIHRVPPQQPQQQGTQGTLRGDVCFSAVEPLASHITPVPGGVGPMTVAMLLSNTVQAWQRHTTVTPA